MLPGNFSLHCLLKELSALRQLERAPRFNEPSDTRFRVEDTGARHPADISGLQDSG